MYSIVAGKFTIVHDNWRGIPVEYWVAPDTVNAGWRTFGETPSMIEIYSRVLSVNFPWSKYDQSVIPDFTYGGMENVSATTQTDLALHGAGGEPELTGRGARCARARAPVVRRSHDHGDVGALRGSTRGSRRTWSLSRTKRAAGGKPDSSVGSSSSATRATPI